MIENEAVKTTILLSMLMASSICASKAQSIQVRVTDSAGSPVASTIMLVRPDVEFSVEQTDEISGEVSLPHECVIGEQLRADPRDSTLYRSSPSVHCLERSRIHLVVQRANIIFAEFLDERTAISFNIGESQVSVLASYQPEITYQQIPGTAYTTCMLNIIPDYSVEFTGEISDMASVSEALLELTLSARFSTPEQISLGEPCSIQQFSGTATRLVVESALQREGEIIEMLLAPNRM